MIDRAAIFFAVMEQLADLAETAPSAAATLRLSDLIGKVHDARSAEEVERAYKETTH